MDNFSMMQQDGGMSDLFGILDLLRQLYALKGAGQQQPQGGQHRNVGLMGAENSGGETGGGARQLPTRPVGGGNPTYGLPAGWTRDQGTPPGWTTLPGGVMRDPNSGDTYDAAGNLLTIGQGVGTPQTAQPTDRIGWLRALAQSSQPDRYGNTPNASTAQAKITQIPDFSKPPLPGNMVDPRNWDPTMWLNHPEWHNYAVDAAYQVYQNQQPGSWSYEHRGSGIDPYGRSIVRPTNTNWHFDPRYNMWGYDEDFADLSHINPANYNLNDPNNRMWRDAQDALGPGQFQGDWQRLLYANKSDWRNAGKPTGDISQLTPEQIAWLPRQGLPGQRIPVPRPAPALGTPPAAGSGMMGIGLPSVGATPTWQRGGFIDKATWKQAGRPGL